MTPRSLFGRADLDQHTARPQTFHRVRCALPADAVARTTIAPPRACSASAGFVAALLM